MSKKIKYNGQRDNRSFGGLFPGNIQCFSTSSFMFMGYYSSKIRAFMDNMLSMYVDDVESSVGEKGIAEKVKLRFPWIKGRTSLWWLVQKSGIEKWLRREGIKGIAFFSDKKTDFSDLRSLLDKGPVILQTNKLGGLRGGHIIVAFDYTEQSIICMDPFGDANTNYRNKNGDSVIYQDEFLKRATGEKIRCIYWKGIK